MKSELRPLAAILAVVGVLDLVMVPFTIHANSQHPGNQVPVAAIAGGVVLGAVTLVSIAGLAKGAKRAFWALLASRILDAMSALLGTFGGPGALFVVTGVIFLVLSAASIVLLVRLWPRGAAQAASGA